MPATTEKQKKFMDAAAHNPEFAKKAGIAGEVAKEFSKESKGKQFGRADLQKINKPKTDHGKSTILKEGGYMKDDMKQDKSMVKKAVGMHDKQLHGGKKTDLAKLKKGGAVDGCAVRGKTKGTMIKMKSGGMC
jgi:hypothetical protein